MLTIGCDMLSTSTLILTCLLLCLLRSGFVVKLYRYKLSLLTGSVLRVVIVRLSSRVTIIIDNARYRTRQCTISPETLDCKNVS